ncbi:hypothetical protein Tco_1053775 [Tanacetum coccineum]|uniref:Uncharacterized protein n=1 Tax=Tanacetum coccineum TaxID=301880 RepID=A0ABQ5GXC0_9ASTR
MNSDQFFFGDTDEEKEVNSLVFGFFNDVDTLLLASTSTTPIIQCDPSVRDHHGAHDRLVAAFFAEQPMYTPKQFRGRFRMRRKPFNRIVRDSNDTCPYFQNNINAVGRCGIFALVKCTSANLQLAYGFVPDSLDEYLQIGTKTAHDCVINFCNKIIELYGKEYLRKPTQTDIKKLYAYHEEIHGFLGMVGSIDFVVNFVGVIPDQIHSFC